MTQSAIPLQQKKPSNHTVSIIVPVGNSKISVTSLYQEIRKQLLTECRAWEIIFIDRSANDDIWSEIKKLSKQGFKYVKAHRLAADHGKAHSISLGHLLAEGDIVISVDPSSRTSLSGMQLLVKKLNSERELSKNAPSQKVSSVFTTAGLILLLSGASSLLRNEPAFTESLNEEVHLPVFHGVAFPQSNRS